MSTSFKFEVIADSSGNWCSNGQRFATREDAEASARDLMSRWYSVREWRVVDSDDDVTEHGPTLKGAGHRVKL